jgi:hypothetical protein
MSLAFLVPNRTVLLLADEALYIYACGARGARLVEAVPWDVEGFERNVANIIAKDCGGKPVLIINDMVEQHYRKERVARAGVSIMDRGSMLKRKLNVAFPNYPIRAALLLKEKLPNVNKKKAADIYIFTAIPSSKQYESTIAAANLSLSSISAFCLLPIESSDMVKDLAAKLSAKKKIQSKWVIFIGQHQNGGLRQVVTKNGELALTRMTPISDDDSDVDMWASEVHQEFKATMSYLSRFGFQQEDGLDVIVISNPSQGDAVQQLIEENCNFHSLTSLEAARHLGMAMTPPDDLRYADILHVAWAARKPRFILPMSAAKLDQVSKPRKMALAASIALILSGVFLSYQLATTYGSISQTNGKLEEQEKRFSQYDAQYQREVQRKEKMGFDVKLVQSSIVIYDELERQRIDILRLFKNISTALGSELSVDRVTLKRRPFDLVLPVAGAPEPDPNAPQNPPLYEAKLQMTYPSSANIEQGNKEVVDLSKALQTVLPDHKVEATKLLKDYQYIEEIVVETGNLERKDISQDFVAEITIRGPAI